jgi:hypothetical protein
MHVCQSENTLIDHYDLSIRFFNLPQIDFVNLLAAQAFI